MQKEQEEEGEGDEEGLARGKDRHWYRGNSGFEVESMERNKAKGANRWRKEQGKGQRSGAFGRLENWENRVVCWRHDAGRQRKERGPRASVLSASRAVAGAQVMGPHDRNAEVRKRAMKRGTGRPGLRVCGERERARADKEERRTAAAPRKPARQPSRRHTTS
ncbi:hypothetical protein BDY21DRAFT_355744 [Lineolata rhizophorae]|uniref:Uncharacterized protein n=1 Tax=Lineolata rhizophorae TaxID=578093 RepID=A0A6A6NPG1_9PEZI|nr:hypothetical protein BDY21DRAFT_355744 [Lineolata rhizophorae]